MVDVLDLEQSAFMASSFGAGILLNAGVYAPGRISKAVAITPSGLVSIPWWTTMFFDLLLPLVAYRLAPGREQLLRVLHPMFLDDPIPEDVIEITEAVFEHVRIEPEMPRNVTREELISFTAPVLVLAQRKGARLQTLATDEGFGSQDIQGSQRLIEAINLVRMVLPSYWSSRTWMN